MVIMWLLIKIFTILSVCGCGAFLVIGFGGIAQSAYGNQLLRIYILITLSICFSMAVWLFVWVLCFSWLGVGIMFLVGREVFILPDEWIWLDSVYIVLTL